MYRVFSIVYCRLRSNASSDQHDQGLHVLYHTGTGQRPASTSLFLLLPHLLLLPWFVCSCLTDCFWITLSAYASFCLLMSHFVCYCLTDCFRIALSALASLWLLLHHWLLPWCFLPCFVCFCLTLFLPDWLLLSYFVCVCFTLSAPASFFLLIHHFLCFCLIFTASVSLCLLFYHL